MPLSLGQIKVVSRTRWSVGILGGMYGIAAVLPTMRERKSGHVINLYSVAGHMVFPAASVYCATKLAVKALSEGLRMKPSGEIRVTNVSPGAVDMELTGSISDSQAAEGVGELYSIAIDADAIAWATAFAIRAARR